LNQQQATVQIGYVLERKPMVVSTGVSVQTDKWNKTTRTVEATGDRLAAKALNQQLASILTMAQDIVDDYYTKHNRHISREELRDALWADPTDSTASTSTSSINQLFAHFLEHKPTLAKGSRQAYNYVCWRVGSDLEELGYADLNVNEFSAEVWAKLVRTWMSQHIKPNTQIHYFTLMRSVFNFGSKTGMITSDHHKNWERPKAVELEGFALTTDEVDRLYEAEMDEALKATRDAFVFQCSCGLRISDMRRITSTMIDLDNQTITLGREQKNNQLHQTYITDRMREILERHGGMPKIHNSTSMFIKYVRRAARAAGLDRIVEVTDYIDGKSVQKRLPVYEALGSHHARRTFITWGLQTLKDPTAVMELSNHRTFQAFKKYIRRSDEEKKTNFMRVAK